ncbi:MAG: prepilin-type N-terminal cleavage/methylation domain-containing protein [Chloroflexi bacterium]|nr:prepilin-type N-terminal cleavage/methylation domain-containing protein [Chloroflexota bacterium]
MKKIQNILASSQGFTLVELLVSLSILTVVVSIFGSAMFQVLSIQRFWTDDVRAVREVRHAGSWFSGDALNATDVLDAGGVARLTCTPSPSVEQITLTWSDQAGTPHNVVYSVTGDELRRDFDSNGTPLVMATGVVANSISFTLCGNTLRLNMDVQADRTTTDNLDLITYLRKLS